ncbi:MAG: helix-turn-helix transcriptional regulator [Clostridia bacterium]
MTTNTLGSQIRQARKNRGFTQEQLAETLHVTRQTVSNWENERFQPDYEMLVQIADVLSLDGLLPQYQPDAQMRAAPLAAALSEKAPPPRFRWSKKYVRVLMLAAAVLLAGVVILLCSLNQTASDNSGYSLAWFQQEQQNEANKAFVRLYTHTPVVKAMRGSPGATPMRNYSIHMKEENGIGFTVERADCVYFNGQKVLMMITETEDCFHEFLSKTSTRIGASQYRQHHFVEVADRETTGLGYVMYGTDDNGNELSFHTYLSFENEYK